MALVASRTISPPKLTFFIYRDMAQAVSSEEVQLSKIRHSLSHVMAQAVLELFPDGKTAIGPSTQDGFYYDFLLPRALTPEDLATIENRMREIIAGKHAFIRQELSAEEAKKLFASQPYKLELVTDILKDAKANHQQVTLTTYKHDKFEDLCRGPHVESLGEVDPQAFKLLRIAGAYWRGDENREQLQRIYGTAFATKEQLESHLKQVEEAEKRDHRKVGKELGLFSADSSLLGGGLVLWHQKGGLIRHLMESFWKEEHLKNGYDLVYSPHIGRAQLWETSGHLSFYKESMYSPIDIDGQEYYLKPMNCPFHILIYNNTLRSYRELPLRMAEMGTVYRYERSGVLHGLLRVRGFTQDDAHHFVQAEKMPEEIDFVLQFCLQMLRSFGFTDFKAYLSTRPEGDKAVGDISNWEAAQKALEQALLRAKLPYDVDEGGGAFYGPKIDIKIKDAIGREWQLSTIQFDFNLPERFDVSYIGEDGRQHRPYMIHRALLGSMERFFGILVEHYAGAFPAWLAPVQVRLLPIAERHHEYCSKVQQELKSRGIRVDSDTSSERLGNKVRIAQAEKIPYALVIGDKELEKGMVAVRRRGGQDLGAMPVPEFIEKLLTEVAEKSA